MFMNLEFLPVRFEDIGKQVLANGVRHPAQYYKDKIGMRKRVSHFVYKIENKRYHIEVLTDCVLYERLIRCVVGKGDES